MTHRAEVITWTNADEMHWEIMLRASLLRRERALRKCRNLMLLSAIATAAPLTLFALIEGAAPGLTAGLAALTIGALGLSAWFCRREYRSFLAGDVPQRLVSCPIPGRDQQPAQAFGRTTDTFNVATSLHREPSAIAPFFRIFGSLRGERRIEGLNPTGRASRAS